MDTVKHGYHELRYRGELDTVKYLLLPKTHPSLFHCYGYNKIWMKLIKFCVPHEFNINEFYHASIKYLC